MALGFLRTRRRRDRRGAKATQTGGGGLRFWGLRVTESESGVCCEAMREMAGRCYPIENAPPLPIPGCDLTICQCRYEYLPERRANPERRSGLDRRSAIRFDTACPDRRSGEDRRAGNNQWKWAQS